MNSKPGYRLSIIIAVLSLVPLYFLLKHTPPDFTQFPAGAERTVKSMFAKLGILFNTTIWSRLGHTDVNSTLAR